MHPLELALRRTVAWLIPALVGCGLLLAIPQPGDPFWQFIIQLSAVVLFGLALAVQLSRFAIAGGWFARTDWQPARRRLAAGAALVALDTGAVALVTLASSAALRMEPSLQFLQLLSTLDIAWAGAAIVIGAAFRWGERAAWVGGLLLGVFCVYAIWRYLDIVGFTADGGWLVSGPDLWRYVIPFDMAAAIVAVTLLVTGAQSGRDTEQASVQS